MDADCGQRLRSFASGPRAGSEHGTNRADGTDDGVWEEIRVQVMEYWSGVGRKLRMAHSGRRFWSPGRSLSHFWENMALRWSLKRLLPDYYRYCTPSGVSRSNLHGSVSTPKELRQLINNRLATHTIRAVPGSGATSSRLMDPRDTFPRVASPSFVKSTTEGRQPWAGGHNPFGIELRARRRLGDRAAKNGNAQALRLRL